MMRFFFVGPPRANHSLLRSCSEGGGPIVTSKVGVSREATQKKSKKRRAKTSTAFLLDIFQTFSTQPYAKHLLLRQFLQDVLRIWVVEITPQGS